MLAVYKYYSNSRYIKDNYISKKEESILYYINYKGKYSI